MAADWDLFIDETKEGGKLKCLGVLALHAGVAEGIFAQLAKAKNALVSRGNKVGEIHWKDLGEVEAEVAQEWLSLFLGGPMMFFVVALCMPAETKETAVTRVLQALENDSRVPYGLARDRTTIHVDADSSDPPDMLRQLRSRFRLLRAFSWESKGSLLLQLCDLLLGIALADSSGSLNSLSPDASSRQKLKHRLLQYARCNAQARARRGKRNGVVLLQPGGGAEFLLLGKM
jgi:hypothetical protein